MAMIITPRQLRLRSELYHQLGALLAAGLPILSALETLIKSPPTASFRYPLRKIQSLLQEGASFAESMMQTGTWMPGFDIALLQAGENSGRLDSCFKLLAQYYGDRSQVAQVVLSQLAYPIFLIHFAVLIIPFPQLFLHGDWRQYAGSTLGLLLPLYAVAFFIIWASQGRHGESWRSLVEKGCGFIPLLGKARRHLALARLAAALEALINAGVSIINAWELAAAASGSPALRRAVVAWRPQLEDAGRTPSELVKESGAFPEVFANLYHSGEISGRLDETLGRLHHYYQEEGVRQLRSIAAWTPRVVYLVVALLIARHVVGFWLGHYSGVMDVFD